MFQAFYELPQCAVERRRHAELFTAICDRAVHEVHFRLALRKNILQHAGLVLAGSIGTFLYKRARIAVKLYAERLRDRLALADQRIEQRPGGNEARRCAMMEKRQRADWICGGVENKLGPLSAAGVLQRNNF